MEEHRAKAAAGKAQSHAVLELRPFEDVGDNEGRLFRIVPRLVCHCSPDFQKDRRRTSGLRRKSSCDLERIPCLIEKSDGYLRNTMNEDSDGTGWDIVGAVPADGQRKIVVADD